MAISYVGSSTIAQAASGNVTVTPPATSTNDVMILAVTSHDNVALSLPAGWTIFQEADNTSAMRATVAWKRCSGAESGFAVTHAAGDGIVAGLSVYSGCKTSGSPINASSISSNASSSTCTATAITTTVNGCMILFTTHDSDNGVASAWSSANLGSMTNRFDFASTNGLDEAVGLSEVSQGSAGSTGDSTASLSIGPDVNSGCLIALEPAGGGAAAAFHGLPMMGFGS